MYHNVQYFVRSKTAVLNILCPSALHHRVRENSTPMCVCVRDR